MKKLLVVAILMLTITACQKEIKTGFVDNAKLVKEYTKKADIETKVQAKIDAFNKRMDSIGKTFQEQAAQLQKEDPEFLKKESQETYQALTQQYQNFQRQFQQEEMIIQRESQTEIDTLIMEVRRFVEDYGKKNGYTYIFGKNDAGSVMHGADENDLTEEILKSLNDSYKKE